MAIKVGINGFGRIGRVVLRIMIEHPEQFDICGINLRKADLDYMVYMIKYDSVFRQFNGTVEHKDKNLIVNGHTIQVFSESDAAMIPWSNVILTAPGKDEVTPTFVMGVNHMLLHSDMKVVSNASCTTNCLAPLAKVVNDEFGIEQALISKYENGERVPPTETLMQLADFYGVSMDYIMGRTDRKEINR